MNLRHLATAASLALLVPAMAACTSNSPSTGADGSDGTVTVTSTDDACEVSSTEVPAGPVTFTVTNSGSKVTEFYLLGEDGLRIVGEVENIGPQLSRDLVVNVPAGSYSTACKPGMKGEGIRADFTVAKSDTPVDAGDQASVEQAQTNYAAYVKDQSDQLLTKTTKFVQLYEAGKDEEARDLYAKARVHWERIETVAESFGDLDPKMDAREADLEPGQKWTGWHRIEKDLWPQEAKDYTALTDTERKTYGQDLLKNTTTLDTRIQKMTFTIDQIANGSRGLLEEVATGKVTGEEEIWSHTDLWDFQANVDGAKVGYDGVRPILVAKGDKELATQLDTRFAALQKLLDQHKEGDGFVSYTDLTKDEVKALSDAVNALSEPLSKLTAAVV
ncbi:PbrT family lead (Pb2+) uptake porter [Janibacter sp. Soil728]|uniref:iron uptake system protein EfeO n=1 Tax=Janibacter sp. Soil728 TaxID=1736393 RepID=UPI000701C5C0|nr:iron uptake system protein EfeO [Janibacter sp. Soil728]KRE37817.1 PbrT family lead (Pb2+) uptake porter [Janibacter sp. Soil728]